MKSLRARITIAATAVLTVVLAVAAVLIVSLVSRQLRNDLQNQNDATLSGIASEIARGTDPARIQLPAGTDGTEFLIETSSGIMVNATQLSIEQINELDINPIDPDLLEQLSDGGFIEFEIPIAVDSFEAVSIESISPDGNSYLVTALTTTVLIDRNVDQVRSVLWLVIPALAAIFAGVVWLITGRTLKPVADITLKAERISSDTLHQRLDEPGTNDEIDRLARTLNSMLGRLDVGARQQQQFVSDASHELQSPLTVIVGEAELAQASGDTQRLAEANELVIEHGRRMTTLIGDLLALARAGEIDLRRHDVDVDDIIRNEARLHSFVVDTRGVAPARLLGDSESLGRLFRNLIDNAARYATSQVVVTCSTDDSHAVVTVSDDGPGIKPEDRARVFERFARVDESRNRATGGTGLGLAIAQAICVGHGGSITVTNSDLGGAMFVVRLPLQS